MFYPDPNPEFIKFVSFFCDSIHGPGRYYAKQNESVRERQTLYDFNYMWNLMNNINKQNRKRLIDTENRLTAVSVEGVWGLGENLEVIKPR